jgi:hypothetical protein
VTGAGISELTKIKERNINKVSLYFILQTFALGNQTY